MEQGSSVGWPAGTRDLSNTGGILSAATGASLKELMARLGPFVLIPWIGVAIKHILEVS
jgi:hypothetical protein